MSTQMVAGLAMAVVVMVLMSVVLLREMARGQRLEQRLRAIQPGGFVEATPGARSAALGRVAGLGTSVLRGRLLSPSTVEGLQQTLRAAGFRGERALGLFLGAKIVLLLVMPVATGITAFLMGIDGRQVLLATLGGAVVGLLLPDMVANSLRKAYLKRLEKGLPDALDLLVICAEAGLSLQPAMQRVSDEIGPVNSAVAAELNLTLYELRILTDRREALARMGTRTKVEALQRLAQSLVQSLQFGTPMSQALRMLASELRQEQLLRFEARAARLPVLLTLPMVFFILPTLFLVVGGPAAIQVMKLW
ncbi:type II secretion system F family protein [Plastoroseomonas arctica]|uniref:Type II secretion system F family protein n=1 Tax=Plastoroseomonas arctica TaxID=1509237 RepID=A0AAF1JUF6_9PROT|nr:type II secretion system F family protein [Plastoroseomonas arctica]MBR0653950.1 type II secretion system F family protein [Plastoroseomonas arctica]